MAQSGDKGAALAFDKELAEAICNLEIPNRIEFSPDGRNVLYSTTLSSGHRKGKNNISTLWLASSTESGSSRRLTSGLFKDTDPRWHPSGNQVAFLSDRSKPGESCAIWIMRLDGGDAVAITPADNSEDIETFAFSPDGETIAYISPDQMSEQRKEKKEKEELDPEVWGERWDYARLRLVNTKSKEMRTLVVGNRHITSLAWSPDGKSVAFLSNDNPQIEEAFLTGTTISTVDVESGKVRDLCTIINELFCLTWAPDGQIYFITGTPIDKDSGGAAVYTIDPAPASPKFVKVACGNYDDASSLAVAGGKLLVNRSVRLTNIISELGGKDLFKKNTEIWAWDVFVDPKTGTPTLAASLSNIDTPYEVFVVEAGQDDIKLSDHGKTLSNQSFGSCTVLTCPSADGEVELDGLYLTPTIKTGQNGVPVEPLPTFVIIHGGPTARDCDYFDTAYYWATYVLTKGYGVLLPQYRGSTGRGEVFASYSQGGQGKYDYADIVSITDNAIKRGFANGEKLMVGGWSQGGLITYLCSVRNGLHGLGWRFNATVAGAGVCDIESLALTSDLGSTYEAELAGGDTIWTLSRDDTRNRQGSALWEVASAVEESHRRGEPVIPPMLILHGDKDERCPFSQGEGFRRALRAHGLPCEFVAYPGEGHGIEQQRFWLDMLERIGRWCDTYIGPGGETKLAIR
ncbi:Alpha/Beta hydrolase protein [Dactylonectria estremocensis]|uniref:Dipeptidyl-peptidase V n=1 Tax=Dactylonectria estremocensis TaxID=1079267 RepID=A0A9P9FDD1_9HYPO|nr:Alpha/Beta hydrolase protein [Dactylonectria estremocensis]